MAWCEKHHRALFVIIHDKDLHVTTRVLYQVVSSYGEVEKISKFQTIGDFHAWVNFYSHNDAVNAFCKLQGHQIYEECCELDLYFASEDIWRCKPYIPRHMLDYRPPKAPLIPGKCLLMFMELQLQGFPRDCRFVIQMRDIPPTLMETKGEWSLRTIRRKPSKRSPTKKKSKWQNPIKS